jgi:hypothetical protein
VGGVGVGFVRHRRRNPPKSRTQGIRGSKGRTMKGVFLIGFFFSSRAETTYKKKRARPPCVFATNLCNKASGHNDPFVAACAVPCCSRACPFFLVLAKSSETIATTTPRPTPPPRSRPAPQLQPTTITPSPRKHFPAGLFCMADGVAPKCCFRLGFAQRFAEHKSRGRRETQDVACSAWLSLRDVLLFLELAVVGRVFK